MKCPENLKSNFSKTQLFGLAVSSSFLSTGHSTELMISCKVSKFKYCINKIAYKYKELRETVRVRNLGLWCLTPLSTIFQLYIVALSFFFLVEETRENYRPVASR